MDEYELTDVDIAAIRSLRSHGCAVVVYLPQEIKDISSNHLEDAMIGYANEYVLEAE